ncbi:hypothetical protein WICMUC_000800 [Wickerhamomyces mucosus]|uniref:Zn(2)-C6 fungal-type domain-containing protein n=1 Tax=Wickerhamomyces mucosus TaxID=1378264 RepID=A0A9P8PXZ9_9ASCO|nr:hypothetical protein WICMUC_000800 [Wickerhamomyces mucosus]
MSLPSIRSTYTNQQHQDQQQQLARNQEHSLPNESRLSQFHSISAIPPESSETALHNHQQEQELGHRLEQQEGVLLDDIKYKKSGKPRLRVKKACDRCKRQKIKCDGENQCKVCLKLGHECTYSSAPPVISNSVGQQPSSTSSTSPKLNKHTSNQEYTKYLEKKIQDLESKLSEKLENYGDSKGTLSKNSCVFSNDKYRVMKRYQNVIPLMLGESIAREIDIPSDIQIPRIQFYGWNLSGGHYLKQRRLPEFKPVIDLSKHSNLSTWLLQYYFKSVNPLYSIIHERVFYDQYNLYLNNISQNDQSTRLFTAMLYLMLAISIRFSESIQPFDISSKILSINGLEEQLFDSAYEVISKISFEWQSYELIQSWILITFYLRITHRQNSSFMALGSAIRMMKGMSLNLNTIPEALRKYSYEELKLKRVFWMVYSWDRTYSFQSGKSFEINDEEVFLDFEELNEDVSDDWGNKLNNLFVQLSVIAGEILKYDRKNSFYTESFLHYINDKLYNWKQKVDNDIKLTKESTDNFENILIDQLYLTYHDIVLNLNNKSLLGLINSIDNNNQSLNYDSLISNSLDILSIFGKSIIKNEFLKPWWLNLSSLFNIAVINIVLLNNNPSFNSKEILQKSLEYLKILESGKFGMVKECIWCLKTLNRLSVLKFQSSINIFQKCGIDHDTNNDVNNIKFYQFGKVSNGKIIDSGPTNLTPQLKQIQHGIHSSNLVSDLLNNDMDMNQNLEMNDQDLMGNFKWFDQWLNEFRE